MVRTRQSPGCESGAPSGSLSATVYSVQPRMPAAWHDQAEWENEVSYSLGFRAGLDAARVAMDAALEDAIGAAPDSAQAIVRRLVRAMDRSVEFQDRVLGVAA